MAHPAWALDILRGARPIVLAAGVALWSCSGGKSETAREPKLNELDGAVVDVDVEMHEGTNMAAAPSPDGSTIVISLQGALWTLSAADGIAKKITPWDVEATQPAWSPDGRLIAFQNYSNGNYHVWLVAPDGSGLRELTTGPFDDREPSWFPDSARIVFSSDRSDDRQYKIWAVTLGGGVAQITQGAGAESNPVVSPDGKQVAFVNRGVIFIAPIDAASSPVSRAIGIAPAWTPDGSGLVYQSGGNLVVNGSPVSLGEDLFPFPVSYMSGGGFMYTADGKIRTRDAAGGIRRRWLSAPPPGCAGRCFPLPRTDRASEIFRCTWRWASAPRCCLRTRRASPLSH